MNKAIIEIFAIIGSIVCLIVGSIAYCNRNIQDAQYFIMLGIFVLLIGKK